MPNPRADYFPIIEREPLQLPNGGRVAVWVIVNVEEWSFDAPMARTVLPFPQGVNLTPDVANYGWYEYGQRVGFWRIKEVLDDHNIRATLSLNGAVCEHYPQIVDESVKSHWEMLGHSYIQRSLLLEDDQRSVIRKTLDVIQQKTGQSPRGWMGPGLGETADTADILAEEGIEYVADWVNDDLPYPMKVKAGTLHSLPYTLELNDIPMYMVQHHRSPEMYDRARDQFETLYRESARGARVMAIAVHPFITGAAHRIKYFEKVFEYLKGHEGVLFMTGSEILDWYLGATSRR